MSYASPAEVDGLKLFVSQFRQCVAGNSGRRNRPTTASGRVLRSPLPPRWGQNHPLASSAAIPIDRGAAASLQPD